MTINHDPNTRPRVDYTRKVVRKITVTMDAPYLREGSHFTMVFEDNKLITMDMKYLRMSDGHHEDHYDVQAQARAYAIANDLIEILGSPGAGPAETEYEVTAYLEQLAERVTYA